MDGFETIAWLRTHAPHVHPIGLSFDTDCATTVRVAAAGACGFLLKSIRTAELQDALDSVMRTGYCDNEQLAQGAAVNAVCRTPFELERDRILATITPKEMEFLQLLCSADEHNYAAIGDAMKISPRSVENHRNHLFEKFGIKSKAGLVQFAMRYGLVTNEND